MNAPIGSDLIVGLVLTAVAYGFLLWAVIHGKHVIDEIASGERSGRPKARGKGPDSDERESGRE